MASQKDATRIHLELIHLEGIHSKTDLRWPKNHVRTIVGRENSRMLVCTEAATLAIVATGSQMNQQGLLD